MSPSHLYCDTYLFTAFLQRRAPSAETQSADGQKSMEKQSFCLKIQKDVFAHPKMSSEIKKSSFAHALPSVGRLGLIIIFNMLLIVKVMALNQNTQQS